ncbi:MAG: hypothetical protein ACOZQL_15715 [Myxococcota bacterium]
MVVKARALLGAALLLAGLAHATTLLFLDVPALTKGSALVVRAKVRSVASRWTKDGGRIMTDAVLDVSETWKGAPVKEVTVMQPGGVVGEVGQVVHGTVKFQAGDEVVVFLEPRGTNYLLTGMVQGRFKVDRTSDGAQAFARQELENEALFLDPVTRQPVLVTGVSLPLDTLRTQVLAASGATAPVEPTRPGPVKVTP